MSGPRQRVQNFIDAAGNPVQFLSDTPSTINSDWVFAGDAAFTMPQITIGSPPIGTADTGVVAQRFQLENDLGSGDVVADTPDASGIATVTIATQIDLTSAALSEDPTGWWIKVGTQVRKIASWSAPIATVAAWTEPLPFTLSFQLFRGNYAAMVFREGVGWAAEKCPVLADAIAGTPLSITAASVNVTDGINTTQIVATPGVNQVFTLPSLATAGTFAVEEVYEFVSNYVKSATVTVAVTAYSHVLVRTANYVKMFWNTITPTINAGTTVAYAASVALPARFRPPTGHYGVVLVVNGGTSTTGYVLVNSGGAVNVRVIGAAWSGSADTFGLFSVEWGL